MKQETLIKVIANTLVATGCNETDQGNFNFSFETVETMLDLKPGTITDKLASEIETYIVSHFAAVAEMETDYNEKNFDITLWLDYCGLSCEEE